MAGTIDYNDFQVRKALKDFITSIANGQQGDKKGPTIPEVTHGFSDETHNCTECRDTGVLIVPHPRSVFDGVWRSYDPVHGKAKYKIAVACVSCQAATTKSLNINDLTTYEEDVPNWRELQ